MPRDVSTIPHVSPISPPSRTSFTHLKVAPDQPVVGRSTVSTTAIASSIQADKQACARDIEDARPPASPQSTSFDLAVGQGRRSSEVGTALFIQDYKDTRLWNATLEGDVNLVVAWLSAGANLHVTDEHGNTVLMAAALYNRTECVIALASLMTPYEINRARSDGGTALTLAAEEGHLETIKVLARRLTPEQLNKASPDGCTALTFAAVKGHTEIVKMLVDRLTAEQINHTRTDGSTALTFAAEAGHVETVQLIANRLSAEQINHPRHDGSTALTFAAQRGHAETIRVMASRLTAEQINHACDDGSTALTIAAHRNHAEAVKVLASLLKSDGLLKPRSDGATALTLAAQEGYAETVQVLSSWLTAEQINHPLFNGSTALTIAAQRGHLETVRVLVGQLTAEQINQSRLDGTTALMFAAGAGDIEIVKLLAGRLTPEQIRRATPHGSNALTLAAERGHTETVQVLAEHLTADQINHALADGTTALMLAAHYDHAETVKVLVDRLPPSEINRARHDGATALMLAAHDGRVEVVRLLLNALSLHPEYINAFAGGGHTALSVAAMAGQLEVLALLLHALEVSGRAASTPATVDYSTLRVAGSYGHFGVLLTWLSSGAKEEFADTFFEAFDKAHRNRSMHPDVLLRAAETGCARLVGILLRRGANADVRRGDGLSALDLAVSNGHLCVLEAWARSGRQVSHQLILDSLQAAQGRSRAADRQPSGTRLDYLEALEEKMTAALMLAASSDWVMLAEVLLLNKLQALGAAVDAGNALGRESLRLAGRRGRFSELFAALSSGPDEQLTKTFFEGFDAVQRRPQNHPSALFDAAKAGHAGVVLSLLARGDEADRQDESGQCPLDLAVNNGHLSVLNAWIASGREISSQQIFNAIQATGRYGGPMHFDPLQAVDASGYSVEVLAQANGWAHLAAWLLEMKLETSIPE
ncbi:ankyrin repeat domain-containing protein [Ottowia thiooxydans]|uniref:Ankyrin repeat protein n=1 Tax=Ottowia thiooxydans TaxID=219182 RepID=A0ABV2Q7J7_9BURK